MLPCGEAKSWLSAYLDGELSGEERQELQTHLQACAACQAELEFLELLDKAMDSLAVPALAGLLSSELRAGLELPVSVPRGAF